MPIEVFIFNRNQSIAQHRWIVVVGSHNPPLQGERPDDAPLIIVKLGRGAWPEVLELFNLREISGVHEQKADSCPHQSGDQEKQSEHHTTHQPALARFRRRRFLKQGFHGSAASG